MTAVSIHRNPLVKAALQLLAPGADRSAILWGLREQYPARRLVEVEQVLRETAVTLAASGVVPA